MEPDALDRWPFGYRPSSRWPSGTFSHVAPSTQQAGSPPGPLIWALLPELGWGPRPLPAPLPLSSSPGCSLRVLGVVSCVHPSLWTDAQEWDCWFRRKLYFCFFEGPSSILLSVVATPVYILTHSVGRGSPFSALVICRLLVNLICPGMQQGPFQGGKAVLSQRLCPIGADRGRQASNEGV